MDVDLKPDVDIQEIKRDVHVLIKSKSDVALVKPNIKESEEPKDEEMEDISGLKCKTIDFTAIKLTNEIKAK